MKTMETDFKRAFKAQHHFLEGLDDILDLSSRSFGESPCTLSVNSKYLRY